MYYTHGKNYYLSIEQLNITDASNKDILNFLRGFIEINSKFILPNNISNYIKNNTNNHIYNKYPLMIIFYRKESNYESILLDKIVSVLHSLKIEFILESKKKTYNKIKYNTIIKIENYFILQLLHYIYTNADNNEIDDYIYSIYNSLSNYKYINLDSENDQIQFSIPKCKIKLTNPYAIMPVKMQITDIGYQIYIIKEKKRISNKTIIYETGIVCSPQYGFILELSLSNNISKIGYISNNTYMNSNQPIEVILTKIDCDLPDIKLPFMIGYLLLKEFTHYDIIN